MSHAKLGVAEENSGRLVTPVRTKKDQLAAGYSISESIIDGSPGTGCPVIASITGADYAFVVTEPTVSGIHDLGCGTGRNACIMAKYLSDEGKITGMDVSSIMERQFNKKCAQHQNIAFIRQRIDLPFSLSEQFDKVVISFVIHGFPHEVRQTVLKNVSTHLKSGGAFFMLDFAEFDMNAMPLLHRFIFNNIECKYAFDFIERDWKQILASYHFNGFEEFFFVQNYVRLLKAPKLARNEKKSPKNCRSNE